MNYKDLPWYFKNKENYHILFPYININGLIVRCHKDTTIPAIGGVGAWFTSIWDNTLTAEYSCYNIKSFLTDKYVSRSRTFMTLSAAQNDLDRQLLEFGFKLLDDKHKILL